jgi:ABC-type antimicrobial peptide transport system, permease component
MLVKELIISALRSLRSHPKRSFLTMIGIIIGIASVITIMSLGNGVKQDTLKQFHATKTGKQTAIINYYSDGTSSANGFDQSDLSLLKSDNKLKIDSIKIMAKDNSFGMPSSVQAQLNDRNHLVELKPVKRRPRR